MNNHQPIQKRFFVAVILLLGILGLFYFQSVFKWWYEDDPLQFYAVSQIANPINIFTEPEIMRSFGAGRAVVPMQILSYWIDVKIFGFDPLAAYLHSFFSLILTGLFLFLTLKKWFQNDLAAAAASIIWLLLPATLATSQFLATRHYVEGLLFALLTIYFTLDFSRAKERDFNVRAFLPTVFCAAAAMLFKEIYAASVVTVLFCFGISYKKYSLIGASFSLAICYFIYRVWLIGTDVSYTMPFLGIAEYARFLAVQAYTFSSNKGGFLIYAAIFISTVLLLKKYRFAGFKETGFFLAVLSSVLIALYPVAFAVLANYKTPGTWYRAPFIVNTILVGWGAYSFSRIASTRTFVIGIVIAALIVLPGTWATRKHWNEKMARAEAEGKFYLGNPDKLLYSEEDADWFIKGLDKMYGVSYPHYINKQNISGEHSWQMISINPTIWRYQEAGFSPDEKLYLEIFQASNPANKK